MLEGSIRRRIRTVSGRLAPPSKSRLPRGDGRAATATSYRSSRETPRTADQGRPPSLHVGAYDEALRRRSRSRCLAFGECRGPPITPFFQLRTAQNERRRAK